MTATVNLAQARHNMIEQQIRPWDVLDQRILDLIEQLPREDFVPKAYLSLAYADLNIPIGHDQVMMAPKVEARLLQSLAVRPQDTALEIGTGSGYLTALLSRSARQVYSVDIYPDLVEEAERKLAAHGIDNVMLETGDAAHGWGGHGPYDVIAVTGSLPLLPDALRESLKPGGRLFVVTGEAPVMEARLITRLADQAWTDKTLFETVLPPLVNATPPRRFTF